MKYIKLFEQFINESISQEDLKNFVDKFDLTDKDAWDADLRKGVNNIIKMYRKGKSLSDIIKENPGIEKIFADAEKTYNDEMIRLALPQGDLQKSKQEIPQVKIKWG